MADDLTGLGRRVSKDERDHKFLLPRNREAAAPITHRTWYSKGVLDQGNTSQCVAYSGVKYLTTAPVMNKPLDPGTLYHECQLVDEWPGEDPEGGTSVRALFKVLKNMGLVGEYRWAFDAETVVNQVLLNGPVCMGTDWFMEMFTPDAEGYIEPKGKIAGGHAWLIIGASRTRKNPDGTRGAVRMINSWGKNWGPQQGRAWIKFSDLDTLIKADGEACVATEILKK